MHCRKGPNPSGSCIKVGTIWFHSSAHPKDAQKQCLFLKFPFYVTDHSGEGNSKHKSNFDTRAGVTAMDNSCSSILLYTGLRVCGIQLYSSKRRRGSLSLSLSLPPGPKQSLSLLPSRLQGNASISKASRGGRMGSSGSIYKQEMVKFLSFPRVALWSHNSVAVLLKSMSPFPPTPPHILKLPAV